jgi:hypothetical protein
MSLRTYREETPRDRERYNPPLSEAGAAKHEVQTWKFGGTEELNVLTAPRSGSPDTGDYRPKVVSQPPDRAILNRCGLVIGEPSCLTTRRNPLHQDHRTGTGGSEHGGLPVFRRESRRLIVKKKIKCSFATLRPETRQAIESVFYDLRSRFFSSAGSDPAPAPEPGSDLVAW